MNVYPKDPTEGVQEIIKYLNGTGNHSNLIAGIYDLIGFGLKLAFGDPTDVEISPEIMGAAINDLQIAMIANPDKTASMPDWLKPLLTAAIQALYTWLMSRKSLLPVSGESHTTGDVG